jgi:biopolymer transport protein ExbD
MAAIQEQQNNNKKGNTQRVKKNSTRVDLTPMVDLGFLLITFFVFTTTMSKPTVMNVNMPFDKTTIKDDVCESCALTVMPAGNNQLYYYEGALTTNNMHLTNFNASGIRKIIEQKKKLLASIRGSDNHFVLIIKPSKEASFKNFVDLLDEVAINRISKYYIDDITTQEQNFFPSAIQ